MSRRLWISRLLCVLGGSLILKHGLFQAQATQAASLSSGAGALTVQVTRPFNVETPVQEFTAFLTPNPQFFVRSHFGPPVLETASEAHWTVQVEGLVAEPRAFTLKDLRQLEAVTITAVVQCSGNGRSFYHPKVPGIQWKRGAVGNAQWTGVRLRDVLAWAGVRAMAQHVQFQGADRPAIGSVPPFIRSVPLEKAQHPDTLLAYEMNGRPLPFLHGAPLRVITPGWMGNSCIKWLTNITVRADETKGYYMEMAYRVPIKPLGLGSTASGETRPVEAMVLKSLITAPQEGARVRGGLITLQGVAWSGNATVVRVEVSMDEGQTWEPARLVGEDHPYAWRQWQFIWNASPTGTVTILCRATDARGEVQPVTSTWNPSGFLWNGWDRVTVTVVT